MPTVANLWRHPIKSHGREALTRVMLEVGKTMPWDRTWAVAHESSTADGSQWEPCANFSRGAKAPMLMAISATLDEASGKVTLRHPERPDLVIDPDHESAALVEWSRPLMPQDRAASARIVRVAGRGMTDTDYPSVSIGNLASHRALEQAMGQPLSIRRWRTNIWLDGLEPWVEMGWPGKTIRIGKAEITIREQVTRCLATTANPDTGARDADTLGAFNTTYGHQEFCIYGEVTKSGEVVLNDSVEVL